MINYSITMRSVNSNLLIFMTKDRVINGYFMTKDRVINGYFVTKDRVIKGHFMTKDRVISKRLRIYTLPFIVKVLTFAP